MFGRRCNSKTQGNLIEKRDIGQLYALAGEVGSGVKNELINAWNKPIALQQWLVASPIVIGDSLVDFCPIVSTKGIEFDANARSRPSLARVEDVCCQATHSAYSRIPQKVQWTASFAPHRDTPYCYNIEDNRQYRIKIFDKDLKSIQRSLNLSF